MNCSVKFLSPIDTSGRPAPGSAGPCRPRCSCPRCSCPRCSCPKCSCPKCSCPTLSWPRVGSRRGRRRRVEAGGRCRRATAAEHRGERDRADRREQHCGGGAHRPQCLIPRRRAARRRGRAPRGRRPAAQAAHRMPSAVRISQSANHAFLGSSGRAGRFRSRCRRGRPHSRPRRCSRGPSAPGRAGWRRRRGGCARRGSRSRRARGRVAGLSSTSIATLPISRGPSARTVRQVEQADAWQRPLAELVAVAEQLVAAADGEHDRAPVGRRAQLLPASARARSSAQQLLVTVLAAADVVQIVRRPGRAASPTAPVSSKPSPRQRAAALAASAGSRGRHRCSSARGRARRRAAFWHQTHRSITTSLPTWSSVAAMLRRPSGSQPGRAGLRTSPSMLTLSRWITS